MILGIEKVNLLIYRTKIINIKTNGIEKMQACQLRESLLERRQSTHTSNLWNNLSLTQKFAASTLTQSGFEIAFIRNSQAGNLAVFSCENNTVTVSSEGEINTSPNISIR